eukprot:TRINITY_DN10968_c0_g1_i1.p1 TRINITY_DN10968_c0_g1~~TRINITY_DN10968_c0_g1_i1.p1  ORF type:complete len:709 (-),score=69.87 TRINITY_DN10968_c0_g1_i1:395-2521(-)
MLTLPRLNIPQQHVLYRSAAFIWLAFIVAIYLWLWLVSFVGLHESCDKTPHTRVLYATSALPTLLQCTIIVVLSTKADAKQPAFVVVGIGLQSLVIPLRMQELQWCCSDPDMAYLGGRLSALTHMSGAVMLNFVMVEVAASLGRTLQRDRSRRVLRFTWKSQVFLLAVMYVAAVIPPKVGGGFSTPVFSIARQVVRLLDFVRYCVALPIFYIPIRPLKKVLATDWGGERRDEIRRLISLANLKLRVIVCSFSSLVAYVSVNVAIMVFKDVDFTLLKVFTGFFLDCAATAAVNVVLSGLLSRSTQLEEQQAIANDKRRIKRKRAVFAYRPCEDVRWQKEVESLADGGFTLGQLLDFYEQLPILMPHYDPMWHTTDDIVRSVVIPVTSHAQCAYSKLMTKGMPVRPNAMVTHTWCNLFMDLVAALVADACDLHDYEALGMLLQRDVPALRASMSHQALSMTYWICALSVNQHAGICGANPGQAKDPVTGAEYEVCNCSHPKYFNTTHPLRDDGKGIRCQMNKFDDMMDLLATSDMSFRQVIAVDRDFVLFERAWCVAELAEARALGMKQSLKMHSKRRLQKQEEQLKTLRIQDMKASRLEDIEEILTKIPDVELFNRSLQSLLFGAGALVTSWCDLDEASQAAKVGHFACLAREFELHQISLQHSFTSSMTSLGSPRNRRSSLSRGDSELSSIGTLLAACGNKRENTISL